MRPAVAVERAGDGGFGGVVDGEAGPDAVGLLAHVQEVADQREGEEGERAEGEDGGDGGGGVLLVGVDGALCGHDRCHAADGAADGEQAGELGREAEDLAEHRHHRERQDQLDSDEDQAHAADVEDVAKTNLAATRTMPSLSQSS